MTADGAKADKLAKSATSNRPVLITGGAGFIGTNLTARLAEMGQRVIVYDDLSRAGVRANCAWLKSHYGAVVDFEIADVRDTVRLRAAVARARHVFHLAAQVAVTTSVADPVEDFEVNARGTLNVLEAIRATRHRPSLLYTSTNKVYGALADVALEARDGGYAPVADDMRDHGVDETQPLDLYSPYGCSKGCADQYVLDHARIYGLHTTVFRMSCIYGPHQWGNEDQGWIAHFLMCAQAGLPITIYGDGLQVRDALYVDDLVDAMLLAFARLDSAPAEITGQAFNIGGGPRHAISLRGLLDEIAESVGRRPSVLAGSWRPGDQRYYVSNVSRFGQLTGWRPTTTVAEGVARLHRSLLMRERTQDGGHPTAAHDAVAAGEAGGQ